MTQVTKPEFLYKGLEKLEKEQGMNGSGVKLKGGNVELTWVDGVFTMKHYKTKILVIDFRKPYTTCDERIAEWYISSQTDAKYIRVAIDYWFRNHYHLFVIGYGSVNGARFLFKTYEGDEEIQKEVAGYEA